MNDVIQAAQKASQQSDRTLFITVILMLALATIWILRTVGSYFITQHKQLIERLETLHDERKLEHSEFVRCVDGNTEMLRLVDETIDRCRIVNKK